MTNALPHEMSRAERRRFVVRGLGRAVAMAIALVAVDFVVPLEWIDGVPVAVVLFIAPLVLLAVSLWQIRAVMNPRSRDCVASKRSRSSPRSISCCSP